MNEIAFILRSIIGFIFLSSGIYKIKNIESHAKIVSEYKIMPSKYVYQSTLTLAYCESILGMFMIIGLFHLQSLSLSLLFLSIFIFAMSLNLLRGNININCGCGGVLGERKISWLLVLRNFLISVIILVLIKHRTNIFGIDTFVYGRIFNHEEIMKYVILTLLSISLMFNISNISNWLSIKNYIKNKI